LPTKLSGASWFKDNTERAENTSKTPGVFTYERQFKTNSFEQLKNRFGSGKPF
jgi:hypothetical protein